MRISRWLAAGVLAGGAAVAGCHSDPDTSFERCPAPQLSVTPEGSAATTGGAHPTVASGSTVRVVGTGFVAGCTAGKGGAAGTALQGIRLYVAQGDQRVSVAQVNATGDDDGFDVLLGIPAALAAGETELVATGSAKEGAPEIASAGFTISGS